MQIEQRDTIEIKEERKNKRNISETQFERRLKYAAAFAAGFFCGSISRKIYTEYFE